MNFLSLHVRPHRCHLVPWRHMKNDSLGLYGKNSSPSYLFPTFPNFLKRPKYQILNTKWFLSPRHWYICLCNKHSNYLVVVPLCIQAKPSFVSFHMVLRTDFPKLRNSFQAKTVLMCTAFLPFQAPGPELLTAGLLLMVVFDSFKLWSSREGTTVSI